MNDDIKGMPPRGPKPPGRMPRKKPKPKGGMRIPIDQAMEIMEAELAAPPVVEAPKRRLICE